MQKFWFFFYGYPNISGMTLALSGLVVHIGLYFMSDKGGLPWWWAVIAALYTLGWLVGWLVEDNNADLHFRQTQTAEEIKAELNKLLKNVQQRIPESAYSHLEGIRESVLAVLPEMVQGNGNTSSHDLYTVKQTVFRYLPDTLEAYLKLPNAYASIHNVQDGKTPKTLLIEQLTMIDDTLQKVVDNIYNQDAQALLVNQRFLAQRLEIQNVDILS